MAEQDFLKSQGHASPRADGHGQLEEQGHARHAVKMGWLTCVSRPRLGGSKASSVVQVAATGCLYMPEATWVRMAPWHSGLSGLSLQLDMTCAFGKRRAGIQSKRVDKMLTQHGH